MATFNNNIFVVYRTPGNPLWIFVSVSSDLKDRVVGRIVLRRMGYGDLLHDRDCIPDGEPLILHFRVGGEGKMYYCRV